MFNSKRIKSLFGSFSSEKEPRHPRAAGNFRGLFPLPEPGNVPKILLFLKKKKQKDFTFRGAQLEMVGGPVVDVGEIL